MQLPFEAQVISMNSWTKFSVLFPEEIRELNEESEVPDISSWEVSPKQRKFTRYTYVYNNFIFRILQGDTLCINGKA